MMTSTVDTTTPFFPAYATLVATHLPDWAMVPPDPERSMQSDYLRGEYVELHYTGSDPDLHGAYLYGTVGRYTQAKDSVVWKAHTHLADAPQGYRSIFDAMTYNQRQAWPGSSINVSLAKAPERVAREITKRLLTHYLPAFRLAMQASRKAQSQQDADYVLGAELAGILGCELRGRQGRDEHPTLYKGKASGLSVQHGSVALPHGFTMTPEQAREFCILVARWEAADTPASSHVPPFLP